MAALVRQLLRAARVRGDPRGDGRDGQLKIDLYASLDKPQSNLTALLVDYGPSTQITRSGDGISTPANAPSDCWGPSSTRTGPDGTVMDFDSCYQQPTKPTVTVTETQGWRVSRGILDSSNRESLVLRRAHDAGDRVPVPLPDHAGGLHVPGRAPGRHRADREPQRAPAQRHAPARRSRSTRS